MGLLASKTKAKNINEKKNKVEDKKKNKIEKRT